MGGRYRSKEASFGTAGWTERRFALEDFLGAERAMRYCPGDLHGGIHLVPDVAFGHLLGGIQRQLGALALR